MQPFAFPLLIAAVFSFGPGSASAALPREDPEARQPAEFEPQRGVMISYPLHVPVEFVAEVAREDEVVTIVDDVLERDAAMALYRSQGVELSNCSFLVHPHEAHWTRDYGPWFAFRGPGPAGVVDFTYEWPNSPGDDGVPAAYAVNEGLAAIQMDLKTAGGNYMTDGHGTGMACDNFLYLNNPQKPIAWVETILSRSLGLNRNHYLADPGPYWFHVDCYAKFLDPDTILVAEVSPGHIAFDQLEGTADYFRRQLSCWGTPYEVVRVHVPNGLYYANSLILNGRVFVPIDGALASDEEALDVYRSAMPGYEVIGVPSLPGPWPQAWVSHDALHCRVKELLDTEMISIVHTPRTDGPGAEAGFSIAAEVVAHSGAPWVGSGPVVHWREAPRSPWKELPMEARGGGRYHASIPGHAPGSRLEYFIRAEDASGRSESHPYVGIQAPHAFTVRSLGAGVEGISLGAPEGIRFELDAGAAHAGESFVLLGSASGTEPGIALPGGLNLPLNRDPFFSSGLATAGGSGSSAARGVLDDHGRGVVTLTLDSSSGIAAGDRLHFAFVCTETFDFVSQPVAIEVLD